MAAHEARSGQPIGDVIDGHRMIWFARRFLGYRSLGKADNHSYGVAYVNRGLRHLRQILNDAGCPDATSRSERAREPGVLTATPRRQPAAALAGRKQEGRR